MSKYKNKKILILGLARSGLSVAKLLHQLGANIIVNDAKPLEENEEAKELISMGIEVITGYHPDNLVTSEIDYVVKNPGIPYINPMIQKAESLNIPVITEVEVASDLINSNIIAVTGTNGKTTTVSLLRNIFTTQRRSGNVFTVGNIGVPVSDIALKAKKDDDVIIELSSFQLIASKDFRPHIAVINNIYSAHLDYHKNREEYVSAKMKITANQTTDDYLVYYKDQEELAELVAKESNATLIPFSMIETLEVGTYLKDNKVYYNQQFVMNLDKIQINGLHNIQNILSAVSVAKLCDLNNEQIEKSINQFTGVKHRSQVVRRFNQRLFVNDSKATNALATQKALEGFNQPTVLISGGLDRHESFEELNNYLENVTAVVTFGETNQKLACYFKEQGINEITVVNTVAETVPVAYKYSKKDSIILFSPACASWDQYNSFEERGDDYVQSIDHLINELGLKEFD